METYFSKLPTILYNNTLTRNLSERVKLSTSTRRFVNAFYPFELANGLRADVVANSYYSDPTMDWMIYLANGITNPYYDWYLYLEEFNAFIIQKYGSIEAAQENISHYQTNWASDPINMTVAGWTSAPPAVQKYYIPVFGAKQKIMSYTRRKEDWIVNTNMIVKLLVSNSASFQIGEIVDIQGSNGSGTVTYTDSTGIMIQHCSGLVASYTDVSYSTSSILAGLTITGETSGTTGTISSDHTTCRTVPSVVISALEYAFWEPVSYWDMETNLNEEKRYVYLLDSNLAPKVAEEIRKSLLP